MDKMLYAPEARGDLVWAFVGTPAGVLALYLTLINVFAFLFYGLDKWKARHPGRRRIPERNLFLAALAGGSLGALLGMYVFRHKTLHRSFRVGIPAILLVQLALGAGWLFLFR